jgi:Histidine kinase
VSHQFRQPALSFWRLQILGWSAFALISMLGALPYADTRQALVYRGTQLITGFLCSFPLWLFCRWLKRRSLPWPRLMTAAILFSYPLGFICSLSAYIVESRTGPSTAMPPRFGSSLLYGFGGSISASFVLIAWSGIYFGVKQWEEAHRREERLLRAEALAREAELRALRYELTPHFLLNTLNGISTLVGEGESRLARRMIARLGDFLRTTLESAGHGDVALEDEVQHMEEYLAIEQVRLGERLQARFTIAPDVRHVSVPNLLLQPLIENAIRHGIAPYESGEVHVCAERNGDLVLISVMNRTQATPAPHPDSHMVRYGVGLSNTKERLASRYGTRHSFEIRNGNAGYWEVIVGIPFQPIDEGSEGKRL